MNWRTHIWLLTMIVILVGCAPTGEPATRGEISLKFEHVSDTSLTLTLTNGLERAVYIRGDRTFSLAIRVWPPDAEVSCQASPSSGLTTEIVSLGQSGSKFVAIGPDKREKIVIPTTLPQRSRGGSCNVYLHLKDDTRVGPVKFQPQ
jgi:hypothetical protein